MRVSIVFLASGFSPQGVDEKEREHHRSYHGSRRIHFFFVNSAFFSPVAVGAVGDRGRPRMSGARVEALQVLMTPSWRIAGVAIYI